MQQDSSKYKIIMIARATKKKLFEAFWLCAIRNLNGAILFIHIRSHCNSQNLSVKNIGETMRILKEFIYVGTRKMKKSIKINLFSALLKPKKTLGLILSDWASVVLSIVLVCLRSDNQRHKGNFYLSSRTLILWSTTDVHISKDSSCLWLYFNINWSLKLFKIEAKNDKGSAK